MQVCHKLQFLLFVERTLNSTVYFQNIVQPCLLPFLYHYSSRIIPTYLMFMLLNMVYKILDNFPGQPNTSFIEYIWNNAWLFLLAHLQLLLSCISRCKKCEIGNTILGYIILIVIYMQEYKPESMPKEDIIFYISCPLKTYMANHGSLHLPAPCSSKQ